MKILESYIVDPSGSEAIVYHRTEKGWYKVYCGSYGGQFLRMIDKVENSEIDELKKRGEL